VGGATPPAGTTAPVATRTDPGFFRRLVNELNPLRQTTRSAAVMSGLGVAALAMDVAATLNLGNPFLFYDRRETWKDMSGLLAGAKEDVRRSLFEDITPNWSGQASTMLVQHVRFNVNGLYSQLGTVSDQSSGTMQSLYKEVLEYDLSVFALYAANAPVLSAVAKMSAHPVGRAALIKTVGVFATALGVLLSQFADVYNAYEGELNKQELALNDLRGAFYQSGNPDQGPRDLDLDYSIESPQNMDYWQPPGSVK
jgi:hypothetical protein